MGTSTKKATTSLSKIEAATEVANKANNVGNTAGPKKIRKSNIGKQSQYIHWRIVSISTPKTCSDGVPKITVLLEEPNEHIFKKWSANLYVAYEDLPSLKVGDHYLQEGESLDAARKGKSMDFEKFAEKYLDQGKIKSTWYVYGLVGYNWCQSDKPTDEWSECMLTDDDGNLIDGHIVYIKKGFARFRGQAVLIKREM